MDGFRHFFTSEKLQLRWYMALLAVWGIAMSFLVPTWQTPDEPAHVADLGNALGVALGEYLYADLPFSYDEMAQNYDVKVDISYWKEAMTKAPSYSLSDVLPTKLSPSIIKHITAAIGIYVGLILRLPTYWVLTLGELFALAAALAICYQALRLMPTKKWVMALVMGVPMTMHQLASLNYDALLLPLCFLFVAYIYHLGIEKETLGWREVLCTLFLLGYIAYIKPPYVFLGLLILMLPLDKLQLPVGKWFKVDKAWVKRWGILVVLAGLVVVIGAVYCIRENLWIRIIVATYENKDRTVALLNTSYGNLRMKYMTGVVGYFGWLDAPMSWNFIKYSLYLLPVMALLDLKGRWPNRSIFARSYRACILLVIVVVIWYLISISMIDFTVIRDCFGGDTDTGYYDVAACLYMITYIGGIQGRYFLPIIYLLPLCLEGAPIRIVKLSVGGFYRQVRLPSINFQLKSRGWIVVVYIMIAIWFSVKVLLSRYWIA